ncbi:MAG TPA: archease [Nitrososphaerales archaeon]|nr:archease [Nitrososphaerales archaeon]HUK75030.1 archease [Nitrososphaerales archaeon]
MPKGRTRSGYRFLPDVALADIAFAARGDSLSALFEAAARALTEVMVDRRTLVGRVERRVNLGPSPPDILLYDLLTQLIVIKDVDSLLFKTFKVTLGPGKEPSLTCVMRGEEIDRDRHALRNDVKAVTMHMFGVKKKAGRWQATVVLDI